MPGKEGLEGKVAVTKHLQGTVVVVEVRILKMGIEGALVEQVAAEKTAREIIKDPYNFDFLTLTENYTERELERGLIDHITKVLMELGAGFAYLGKQVPLQVGQRDFFLDLLFYHTRLHCYVVIELKVVEFEPEHAGKLNFYIKAVDEQLRKKGDTPTIGILLCKGKDSIVAEYALSDIHKPMGVSEYELTQALPDELKASLPTIEQIEAELQLED